MQRELYRLKGLSGLERLLLCQVKFMTEIIAQDEKLIHVGHVF